MAKGIVYLVGAGPGDPGLITVRGVECLRRADVVIYDGLANSALLAEAPDGAELIPAGKSGLSHQAAQERIHELLIDRASRGKVVVRLKGGDPWIFARGGEEALVLAQAKVPFEIVPGVTSGFAAAAYAGIPLTHRDFAASVALVTGHEDHAKGFSRLRWEHLATGVDTLVFYMGMANLTSIARHLMDHGRSPQTPVAVVQWATTSRQRSIVSTLQKVGEEAREGGLESPAILIVGEVVSLRQTLRWFDHRPLLGKRVLVTRTAEQAGAFAALLEAQGAEVVFCPTIEILPVGEGAQVDAELERLRETDQLILTSTNAVEHFFARLRRSGRDLRSLAGIELVAVGPKTAAALEDHGLLPDLVPEEYRAEGVVELLLQRGVKGKRILYPRAELSRDLISRELAAAGAQVAAPVLYQTVLPEGGGERLRAALEEGVDIVTFTSSSTVENFMTLAGSEAHEQLKGAAVVSIGPLTSRTAEKCGLKVAAEARAYTLEGMVEAMMEIFRNREPGDESQRTP